MKTTVPPILEAARVVASAYGTLPKHGFKGHFHVTTPAGADLLVVGHPNHQGREHVAVVADGRFPTPEEMEWAKSLFWDGAEAVSEPQEDASVPNGLHLFRPLGDGPNPPMGR